MSGELVVTAKGRLVVLGAGGHGKVLVSAAQEEGWHVIGVLDDDPSLKGQDVLGTEIMGGVDLLDRLDFDAAVIGVGANLARQAFAGRIRTKWTTVIHPSAVVHSDAEIGVGTVIFAGAIVQPGSVIGDHVILNTGASVDHDCRVGSFAHLAPGCALAGHVTVGEGAFVGIGSTAIPGAVIGAWATVGAGASVVQPVEDGMTVVGVPAHPVYRT